MRIIAVLRLLYAYVTDRYTRALLRNRLHLAIEALHGRAVSALDLEFAKTATAETSIEAALTEGMGVAYQVGLYDGRKEGFSDGYDKAVEDMRLGLVG